MQTLDFSLSTTDRHARERRARALSTLWIAVAVSLAVHAGLLAWHTSSAPRPALADNTLEVAIVNAHTDTAPPDSTLQAQVNVDGGGTAQTGFASSALPRTDDSPDSIVLEALRKRQAELEAERTRLLTQLAPTARAAPDSPPADDTPDTAGNGGDNDADQAARIQNARLAALAPQETVGNKGPRRSVDAPAAVAAAQAAYVAAWRSRVEAVGTAHYPDSAGGRLYGSLRMTVTLNADGSIANLTIDRPAASPALNQAARRIIQLAAPFDRFPDALASQAGTLSITRTWHFVNETLDMRAQ